MLSAILLTTLTLGQPGGPPPVSPPPLPKFTTPVDYLGWYRAQMRFAATSNGRAAYAPFLGTGTGASAPQLAPPPGSPAAEQLVALLEQPDVWYTEGQPALARWVEDVGTKYYDAMLAGNQAAFLSCGVRPGAKHLVGENLCQISNGRWLGQMMLARGWCAVNNRLDNELLLTAFRSNFIYANQVGCGVRFQEQMIASGQRNFLYQQLRMTLSSTLHFAPFWKGIDGVLARYDTMPLPAQLARMFAFEEAAAFELIQDLCPPGISPPRVNMDRVDALRLANSTGLRLIRRHAHLLENVDPQALAAAVRAYYDGLRSITARPTAAHLAADLRAHEDRLFGREPALRAVVIPQSLVVKSAFRGEATRRMTHWAVRLAVHLKETGTWPASLAALADDAADPLLVDPYNGAALQLKTGGRALLLWSVGPDGKDDAGNQQRDVTLFAQIGGQIAIPAARPADPPAAAPPPSPAGGGDPP